jgi:hypothetical protein
MTVERDPKTGHLKKGSVLNPKGRKPKEKPKPPLTLAEMRKALTHRIPELIDRVYAQAMEGDVVSQKLLLDKCMPSLKAVHIETGASELPMLMLNVTPAEAETLQRVRPAQGQIIEGGGASKEGGEDDPRPSFVSS